MVISQKTQRTLQYLKRQQYISALKNVKPSPESAKNKPDLIQLLEITPENEKIKQKNNALYQFSTVYYGKCDNQGKPHDIKGLMVFQQGQFYFGEFRNGKKQGKGKMTSHDHQSDTDIYSYDGEWLDNVPHGKGYQIIGQKVRYTGLFEKGKKHGKGIQQFVDGSTYVGIFDKNKITGQGIYSNTDNIFKGNWVDGYLQGEGVHKIRIDKRTDVYEGSFKEGYKNGKGIFKWGDRKEYQGHFSEGSLNGVGLLKIGNKVFQGEWEKGQEQYLNKYYQTSKIIMKAKKNTQKES